MATIDRYLGKVFHGNALDLLRTMRAESVDACIADPMYGVRSPHSIYDWGADPAKNDPVKHWQYHKPIYEECRRVLKPGGILAWSAGVKFYERFPTWFGGHRVWTLSRFGRSRKVSGNIWIVQTREQQPISFPADRDGVVLYKPLNGLRDLNPCPKTVEEMAFMIESLTKPRQIVLDCFCGTGTTLVAAEQLGRKWIGCDLSRRYCQVAMRRLKALGGAVA